MREFIDNLMISYLDLDANKSIFCNNVAKKLDIDSKDVIVQYKSLYHNSVKQYLIVYILTNVSKDKLFELDFDYVDENGGLVLEVGDVIL